MTTNLKPADELFTIREQIKILKTREAELRYGMLGGTLQTGGNFAVARIVSRKSSS